MAEKYEVLAGVHYEADNKRYVKGDIVESEVALDKKFPDRFLKVSGKKAHEHKDRATRLKDLKAEVSRLEAEEVEESPAAQNKADINEKKAKARAETNKPKERETPAGTPADEESVVATKDKREIQEEADLTDEEEDEEKPSRAMKHAKQLGEDVTTKFPAAKKKGLTVHRTEEGDYQIAKKGKIVGGGESLSRGKVKGFITKHKGK